MWLTATKQNRFNKTFIYFKLCAFKRSVRLAHLLSEEVTLEESKEAEETAGNKEMQLVMMNWSYYHRRLKFKSWSVS